MLMRLVLADHPCACLALEHCFSLFVAGMCLWKGLMETSSKSGETEVQPQTEVLLTPGGGDDVSPMQNRTPLPDHT